MKTALLIGSTGLIGKELLSNLLQSSHYDKVIIFVRKKSEIIHPKLEQVLVNFDKIEEVKHQIKGDDFFCTIGTTIKTAGSKDAFRKVDFEYPKQFSQFAQENKASQFLVISSLGADKNSTNFYLKTKGELQYFLKSSGFKSVSILQPSLLLGNRTEFRLVEKMGSVFSKLFPFVFIGSLKKYKPIEAKTVANAMIKIALQNNSGFRIYQSDELEEISK
ncbi:NAD(P)H-binding protein [Flavobacterium sp.]|uniref:NAD(P)H-binding protein n=1 Tax=Flavobacterium sp. TaxID=239 RepID=UPI00374FE44A